MNFFNPLTELNVNMKKKIVLSLAVVIPIFIMAFADRSSSGAPASHTGAPGEKTCATAGCHDDNALNSGAAKLTIGVASGGVTKYVAGQTYPITIRISDANSSRFGFQIVALDQTANNAGVFAITDPGRTQFMVNQHELADRKYITYTFSGTDATSSGAAEWTVNWTAPATTSGNVTFYAAAVSADDDGTDKGDVVYTTNNTLTNQ
jgi:hypothetical protein